LAQLAEKLNGDVIVVGSRGLSGTDAVLGSVSDLVVHYATVPVLVVPNPLLTKEFDALGRGPVVVGYDGSDGAETALETARRLFPGRRLLLAAVRDDDEDVPVGPAARGVEVLPLTMPKLAGSASRVAADLLVECADQHEAAVLVVGSRGRSTIREVLLGSVARTAVHRAHRPVLVVHS
jgi:nucleotide-binding universal stress UspA family protein